MRKARRTTKSYRIIRCKTWTSFVSAINSPEFASWTFRGQSDSRWGLYSKLSRHLLGFKIHLKAWSVQEKRILRIFKRKAHHHLEHLPREEDTFEWLALMQHHGAPTRLLDFTWSAYVASFFALEHSTGDCAVWALNPPQINRSSLKLDRKKPVNPRKMGPWKAGNLERYFFTERFPIVSIGEPYVMNPRLTVQKGTFVIPGVLDKPVEELLAGYPDPENTVVKFELVTSSVRNQALKELYDMNISYATLFPDLDGLARSLAYELEFNWAFDPRTMESLPGFEGYTAEVLYELDETGGTRRKSGE